MAKLSSIVQYCDELLDISKFKDYAPNGLQVEGKNDVQKIVGGVTGSQALIDAAIELNADAILVHHGFFWRNEDPRIVGIKGNRIKALMQSDISLLAYHLPLDAHAKLGNNIQLARILDIEVSTDSDAGQGQSLVMSGIFNPPISINELSKKIAKKLGRMPLVLPGGSDNVEYVAWCTGAAQSYIDQAVLLGADAYISGEVSESTTHSAKEMGITYFAAGHHATERYGVKCLLENVKEKFSIDCVFVDIDNPV